MAAGHPRFRGRLRRPRPALGGRAGTAPARPPASPLIRMVFWPMKVRPGRRRESSGKARSTIWPCPSTKRAGGGGSNLGRSQATEPEKRPEWRQADRYDRIIGAAVRFRKSSALVDKVPTRTARS
jgi:hypothetical protein